MKPECGRKQVKSVTKQQVQRPVVGQCAHLQTPNLFYWATAPPVAVFHLGAQYDTWNIMMLQLECDELHVSVLTAGAWSDCSTWPNVSVSLRGFLCLHSHFLFSRVKNYSRVTFTLLSSLELYSIQLQYNLKKKKKHTHKYVCLVILQQWNNDRSLVTAWWYSIVSVLCISITYCSVFWQQNKKNM